MSCKTFCDRCGNECSITLLNSLKGNKPEYKIPYKVLEYEWEDTTGEYLIYLCLSCHKELKILFKKFMKGGLRNG